MIQSFMISFNNCATNITAKYYIDEIQGYVVLISKLIMKNLRRHSK